MAISRLMVLGVLVRILCNASLFVIVASQLTDDITDTAIMPLEALIRIVYHASLSAFVVGHMPDDIAVTRLMPLDALVCLHREPTDKQSSPRQP